MDQGNYSSIGVPKKLNFLLKNLNENKVGTFKRRKSKPRLFIYGFSELQKNTKTLQRENVKRTKISIK